MVVVLLITLALLAIILYVPSITAFFKIASLNGMQLGITAIVGFASVFWFEEYKWWKRRRGANEIA
jgi:Ca2+-transporting ATPase